jgi:transposase
MRRRAIEAVESCVPQVDVVRIFEVSRQTVGKWVRIYRSKGEEGLRPRRRGRRPGEQFALSSTQQK